LDCVTNEAHMTATLPEPIPANFRRESGPSPEEEDLNFRPSDSLYSLGVEMEFQIVDRETGDLVPGAPRILPIAEERHGEMASAEMLQSMIEIKTGVCHSVAEVQSQLLPVIRDVRNIALSQGYDLSVGGTHPFSRSTSSTVFPAERYESIKHRMAGVAYQVVCFGLHVHVGVPSGDQAMAITNVLAQYLPHLLAASVNSPCFQGVDTGMASYRTALFGLVPQVGVPHYFRQWKDFCKYVEVMRSCGAIHNTKDIHWDIRPRPKTGTIEFRVCDMPPTLSHAFALVALMRSLVRGAVHLLEKKPKLLRGDRRSFWILPENKWLAARYGLDAQCIRTPGGRRRPLRDELASLVARLTPFSEEFGDSSFLDPFRSLDRFESGAERQRRTFREAGDWRAVSEAMRAQLAQDIETHAKEVMETPPKSA
jgi:carboxylate-amine ligase